MPNEYSLSELAKLSGVTPRTVRYYITEGLLPGPTQAGATARYTDTHLDRLRLIKRLQASHLPLSEIRRQLLGVPDEDLATMARLPPPEEPADSALDYIHGLLARKPDRPAMRAALRLAEPAAVMPEPAESTEPERAHWERIALDPDIEIHIRRPLSRQQNKRVERLISIARQLLEEE